MKPRSHAYELDPWLESLLACPRDKSLLTLEGDRSDGTFYCEEGHAFPLAAGLPVMLDPDEVETQWNTTATLKAVHEYRNGQSASPVPSYASDKHRNLDEAEVHPHVQDIITATCGNLYRQMRGKMRRYPIPDLRLEPGRGRIFLDVGSNWGRWCVAAARMGYMPVGIDPAIEAAFAAREVARQLGIRAVFLVGDGRYLPFRANTVDVGFSYSVLQHLSKSNASRVLRELSQVVRPGGEVVVQMPNAFGLRSSYHLARRAFREGDGFEVRYWTPRELTREFTRAIGESNLEIDGFFGLGVQPSDKELMPAHYRAVVTASELLRKMSHGLPVLKYVADSLYVRARVE